MGILGLYPSRTSNINGSELLTTLNESATLATEDSITAIINLLRSNKKVICITLTEDKDLMYEKILDAYLEKIIGKGVILKNLSSGLISEAEKELAYSLFSKILSELTIVCYDELKIGEIRTLLRCGNYEHLIIISSRFNKKVKRKCYRLQKDFRVDIVLNMFPRRRLG